MSMCGAIENDSLKQTECKFYEKVRFEFKRCVHNPFLDVCTCLKAQIDRDAGGDDKSDDESD